MKKIPPLFLELLVGAFVVACASTGKPPAHEASRARSQGYGQCTAEGDACVGHHECCSQWCANYECVRREP